MLAESSCLDKQDPPGVKSGHRGPVKTGQHALLRVEGSGWAEHRMELSGGLVPGPSSLVGRKSGTVVHWRSEWPLGVRSDGQPVASHTGSLYQGLSWTVSLFFFSPPPFLTQCPTRKNTNFFPSHKWLFLSASPRDSDAATLASFSVSPSSSSSSGPALLVRAL